MNAVINGGRVECGKCGALLCKYSDRFEYSDGLVEYGKLHVPTRKIVGKKIALEIKCKHKDRGVYCNGVNEILL